MVGSFHIWNEWTADFRVSRPYRTMNETMNEAIDGLSGRGGDSLAPALRVARPLRKPCNAIAYATDAREAGPYKMMNQVCRRDWLWHLNDAKRRRHLQ